MVHAKKIGMNINELDKAIELRKRIQNLTTELNQIDVIIKQYTEGQPQFEGIKLYSSLCNSVELYSSNIAVEEVLHIYRQRLADKLTELERELKKLIEIPQVEQEQKPKKRKRWW